MYREQGVWRVWFSTSDSFSDTVSVRESGVNVHPLLSGYELCAFVAVGLMLLCQKRMTI
jgi:hypothetical protein